MDIALQLKNREGRVVFTAYGPYEQHGYLGQRYDYTSDGAGGCNQDLKTIILRAADVLDWSKSAHATAGTPGAIELFNIARRNR